MTGAFIIANAQDTKRGFARLASNSGEAAGLTPARPPYPKYVLQVGNVNQVWDWSRDPLALVSTGVPILSKGVAIHHDFDSTNLVRLQSPVLVNQAASFVHCFVLYRLLPLRGWTPPEDASVSCSWIGTGG